MIIPKVPEIQDCATMSKMREVIKENGTTKIIYRPYKNEEEKRNRKEQLKGSKSSLQRTLRRATESNSRQLEEIKAAIQELKPIAPRKQEEEKVTRTVQYVETRHPTVRFDYKSFPIKEDKRRFESRNSDLYIPDSSKEVRSYHF
jgi:adenine-specific DNA methylase